MDVHVGSLLGPYRIERYIGRGGMGVVYLAQHQHLGRRVALKLLAPELAGDESFRERFVRESRVAAKVDHPNVIPIYEANEVDGVYFIAMRYVDGVDLREILRTAGPLNLERALGMLTQVAGALDAAHEQGLVHRDVKPGNILVVSGSDHCYITDFGLTKAVSSTSGFTATGTVVGTTDYMAPEQIEGKQLDRRTDVYSLGCVFYEMLAGVAPFRRETDMAVMWAHMQEPPPSVAARRPDLPSALDGVIATALAKRKDDRFPSASSFAAAARAAIERGTVAQTPSLAVTSPRAQAPPAPTAPAYPTATPPPEPPRRERSRTGVALVVAALLVAGGGTAAALIITGKKDKPVAATPAAETQTITTTVPTPAPPVPAPQDNRPTPAQQAQRALVEHWKAIENQDFATAYDYIDPSVFPDRTSWITSHEQAGITRVILRTRPGTASGDNATVDVTRLVTFESCGRKDWGSTTYDMVSRHGRWLIHASNFSQSPPCA
jgi:serine/threonine protein kinase